MKYLSGVVSLAYNEEKCEGCGLCAIVCPHGVFEMRDRKAAITDIDRCMECGACAMNCKAGAIGGDFGVGCAAAIINSMINGGPPTCDCAGGSSDPDGCC